MKTTFSSTNSSSSKSDTSCRFRYTGTSFFSAKKINIFLQYPQQNSFGNFYLAIYEISSNEDAYLVSFHAHKKIPITPYGNPAMHRSTSEGFQTRKSVNQGWAMSNQEAATIAEYSSAIPYRFISLATSLFSPSNYTGRRFMYLLYYP